MLLHTCPDSEKESRTTTHLSKWRSLLSQMYPCDHVTRSIPIGVGTRHYKPHELPARTSMSTDPRGSARAFKIQNVFSPLPDSPLDSDRQPLLSYTDSPPPTNFGLNKSFDSSPGSSPPDSPQLDAGTDSWTTSSLAPSLSHRAIAPTKGETKVCGSIVHSIHVQHCDAHYITPLTNAQQMLAH